MVCGEQSRCGEAARRTDGVSPTDLEKQQVNAHTHKTKVVFERDFLGSQQNKLGGNGGLQIHVGSQEGIAHSVDEGNC